jgi:hypothetical protein
MPKIQLGDAEYRIVGDNGEEGEVMLYGQPAVLDCEGGQFMTTWDLDKEGDPVCKLKKGMMINTENGQTVQTVETEEVDFAFDDDTNSTVAIAAEGGDDDEGLDDDDEDEDEDLDDDEDDDDDDEEPELEALRREL